MWMKFENSSIYTQLNSQNTSIIYVICDSTFITIMYDVEKKTCQAGQYS